MWRRVGGAGEMRRLRMAVSAIRLIPHLMFYYLHPDRETIHYDVDRWLRIYDVEQSFGFIKLMTFSPEYRNLFYKRIGRSAHLIQWLCPPMKSLQIHTNDIGPGLFIQHGVASLIGAESIGKDCWINQQVSIGHVSAEGLPILGDHVAVHAGAKVLGPITVGDNSRIGANAVVVKDVPSNCTVVGVPAYIIKRDGNVVHEEL